MWRSQSTSVTQRTEPPGPALYSNTLTCYELSAPAAGGRLACLLSTRMLSIIICKEFTAEGTRQKLSTAPRVFPSEGSTGACAADALTFRLRLGVRILHHRFPVAREGVLALPGCHGFASQRLRTRQGGSGAEQQRWFRKQSGESLSVVLIYANIALPEYLLPSVVGKCKVFMKNWWQE